MEGLGLLFPSSLVTANHPKTGTMLGGAVLAFHLKKTLLHRKPLSLLC